MMGIRAGRKEKRISSFTNISLFLWVMAAAGIFLTGSCTKTGNFTLGEDFVESQTKLQILDTFKVNMFTVLLDSVATSSQKIAYAGSYKDNIFGTVKCESYFDLAYQPFDDIDTKAIFDSAAVRFNYSKASYGDTTALMTLNLHRLTEVITPLPYISEYSLFNTTSYEYEPDPIGTITFYPTPKSLEDTTVNIHIDALGEEMFNLIRDKDAKVTTSEGFSDYLKGFILTQGNAEDKAIIGFKADGSHLLMKLYYHIDQGVPVNKEISITMGLANHQFNHVDYNPEGSPLFQIKQEGNVVFSNESDNKGFMEGLVGLVTVFRFPSIQDLFSSQRWNILKAELILTPANDTYDHFSLPKNLYIYNTDKLNSFGSALLNANRDQIVATLNYDKELNENTAYTFDITGFLNNELSDLYFNYDHGLMVTLNHDGDLRSSLDRLVIEGKKPAVKLRIYYLSY
jgi:Domain of unknown function (DUF4270)